MSSANSRAKAARPASKPGSGRLFFLDLAVGRILTSNPDGSDVKTIVNEGRKLPDGIVVDVAAGHIYWTNMGNPKANDGTIDRADLDGTNVTNIVPSGATWTPKQLQLDAKNRKLYWSDREGMRVMRSNLDGSNIETLVETGHGDADRPDARNWCVGIAIDVNGGKFYWTQKGNDNAGEGRIFRAGLEIPKGQTPANRRDIEVLFDNLPEPIDLDLDLGNRIMYWTDRGDPPRGNRKQAHVPHRFGRIRLQRQSRRIEQEKHRLRPGKFVWHRIRGDSCEFLAQLPSVLTITRRES